MDADNDNTQAAAAASETRSLLLSALRAPTNPVLLSDLGPVMPVVVYTGPTRSPSQLATLSSDIAAEPDNKKKTKHQKRRRHGPTTISRHPRNRRIRSPSSPSRPIAKPTDAKPAVKPADTKPTAQASAVGDGDGAEEAGQAQTAGRGACAQPAFRGRAKARP